MPRASSASIRRRGRRCERGCPSIGAAMNGVTNGRALLAGLRVLEMTQVLSGPFGAQILADLGADVIKLEPPNGDLARAMQPHFIGNDSVYFISLNRNKRSIAVHLKRPEGAARGPPPR